MEDQGKRVPSEVTAEILRNFRWRGRHFIVQQSPLPMDARLFEEICDYYKQVEHADGCPIRLYEPQQTSENQEGEDGVS